MTRRSCRLFVTGTALLFAFGGSAVAAEKTPQQLMRCWDQNAKSAKDQRLVYDMEIQDKQSGGSRTLTTHVWLKGGKRLVVFTAPANVAGMKVLSRSRSQMYVYLKGFKRIRRITSHARSQTLFGGDYNYDDQSTVFFSEVFAAKKLSGDAKTTTLQLDRLPKAEAAYRRIIVKLDNKMCVPLHFQYFNEQLKHVKSETRSGYTCRQNVCNAKLMHMVNHARDDHWTKMHRRKWELNVGIPDSRFTRRALQRRD